MCLSTLTTQSIVLIELITDVERLLQIRRANTQDQERNRWRISPHDYYLLPLRCFPRAPTARHARGRTPTASRNSLLLLSASWGHLHRGNNYCGLHAGVGGSRNADVASMRRVCVGGGVVLLYSAALFGRYVCVGHDGRFDDAVFGRESCRGMAVGGVNVECIFFWCFGGIVFGAGCGNCLGG